MTPRRAVAAGDGRAGGSGPAWNSSQGATKIGVGDNRSHLRADRRAPAIRSGARRRRAHRAKSRWTSRALRDVAAASPPISIADLEGAGTSAKARRASSPRRSASTPRAGRGGARRGEGGVRRRRRRPRPRARRHRRARSAAFGARLDGRVRRRSSPEGGRVRRLRRVEQRRRRSRREGRRDRVIDLVPPHGDRDAAWALHRARHRLGTRTRRERSCERTSESLAEPPNDELPRARPSTYDDGRRLHHHPGAARRAPAGGAARAPARSGRRGRGRDAEARSSSALASQRTSARRRAHCLLQIAGATAAERGCEERRPAPRSSRRAGGSKRRGPLDRDDDRERRVRARAVTKTTKNYENERDETADVESGADQTSKASTAYAYPWTRASPPARFSWRWRRRRRACSTRSARRALARRGGGGCRRGAAAANGQKAAEVTEASGLALEKAAKQLLDLRKAEIEAKALVEEAGGGDAEAADTDDVADAPPATFRKHNSRPNPPPLPPRSRRRPPRSSPRSSCARARLPRRRRSTPPTPRRRGAQRNAPSPISLRARGVRSGDERRRAPRPRRRWGARWPPGTPRRRPSGRAGGLRERRRDGRARGRRGGGGQRRRRRRGGGGGEGRAEGYGRRRRERRGARRRSDADDAEGSPTPNTTDALPAADSGKAIAALRARASIPRPLAEAIIARVAHDGTRVRGGVARRPRRVSRRAPAADPALRRDQTGVFGVSPTTGREDVCRAFVPKGVQRDRPGPQAGPADGG